MLTALYFQKPAREIIEDICLLAVPEEVLRDESAWTMLCNFNSSHASEITKTDWAALCRFRCRLDNWITS
jgi:hypothetical protein